jgi:hypothetical protein
MVGRPTPAAKKKWHTAEPEAQAKFMERSGLSVILLLRN